LLPAEADVSRWLAAAGAAAVVTTTTLGVMARIEAARAADVLVALRDADGDFDMLVDLFGIDTGDRIDLRYHLRALERDEDLYIVAYVDYDGEAPSVWHAYPAALYAEREAAEMFGMTFAGHPNLKRLLTSDEVASPLLRKSTLIRTWEETRRD
jgi:NADH:ubiquinone oxidoreductase subunit C